MPEAINRNLPTKAGRYWARTSASYTWYNLIVTIVGDVPYLRVESVVNFLHDNMTRGGSPTSFYYGPEIEAPKVPRENIDSSV